MGKKEPTGEVTLYSDGKYRWVYEKSLWKHPTVLYTILKIFIGIWAVGSLLMYILIVVEDTPGGLDGFLKISVLMLVILVVLSFVGCVAYSVSMGGKYCVVFTLDEKGVIHQQHDSQAKKAELLSDLAIFAGALAANPTAVGIGITSRRTMMETKFKNVHWIKVERGYDTIHVDTNEVYVLQDDFDFVLYYIIEHCPKAEVKEK